MIKVISIFILMILIGCDQPFPGKETIWVKRRLNHITGLPVIDVQAWHGMHIASSEHVFEDHRFKRLTRHPFLNSSWSVPEMTDSVENHFKDRAQRALDKHIKYCNE